MIRRDTVDRAFWLIPRAHAVSISVITVRRDRCRWERQIEITLVAGYKPEPRQTAVALYEFYLFPVVPPPPPRRVISSYRL